MNFKQQDSNDKEFDIIINHIKENQYSREQMDSLAYAIGLNIRHTHSSPNVNYGNILHESDIQHQINEYDSKLQSLITSLSRTCNNYKVLLNLEHLYSLSDNNFIDPLSFSRNLISYYITGSRTIVDLNNKLFPSRSYYTISSF